MMPAYPSQPKILREKNYNNIQCKKSEEIGKKLNKRTKKSKSKQIY